MSTFIEGAKIRKVEVIEKVLGFHGNIIFTTEGGGTHSNTCVFGSRPELQRARDAEITGVPMILHITNNVVTAVEIDPRMKPPVVEAMHQIIYRERDGA